MDIVVAGNDVGYVIIYIHVVSCGSLSLSQIHSQTIHAQSEEYVKIRGCTLMESEIGLSSALSANTSVVVEVMRFILFPVAVRPSYRLARG